MASAPKKSPEPEELDVAILGGGIAGLTLALQLHDALPGLRVGVIERQPHPVPESAHKVGESSVEVQAHYLHDIIGLAEHLETEQLHKFGLRMFMTHADNSDISRRVEFGQIESAPLPSFQMDRGRLENHLGHRVREAGILLLTGQRIDGVELGSGDDDHVVRTSGDGDRVFRAHWVVDATGRAGLLKRQLGLARTVDHRANSSWFRIDHEVDVDSWSSDPQWRGRVPSGLRRLSTNHLMGPGYWVWLIPLAGGTTSIGIVADDSIHPHVGYNTQERALDWLRAHEPQLAAEVEEHRDGILDFRVMRDYAYGCTQVYDAEARWCLTGEAAVAIDPLYSSGGDLIAIGNGLITDLVTRERAGEDVTDVAVGHNQIFLVMSDIWLIAYRDQYPIMGNPRVMIAKVIWDTIIYWSVPGLLFFHDAYKRLATSALALPALYRTWEVHDRVQQFLREWATVDPAPSADTFADPYSLLDFLVDLHNGMAAGLDPDALDLQLTENVGLLERVAGQMATVVSARLTTLDDPLARAQAETWQQDPLLAELRARYAETRETNPIDPAWVTLGDAGPTQEVKAA
jgi:flavin-dependent dehydrogenase